MDTDYNRFWAAVSTLADAFRHDDPQIIGNVLSMTENLRTLPTERQAVIRSDLQLLLVHLSKLPHALAAPTTMRSTGTSPFYNHVGQPTDSAPPPS
jgi:hypothetical protein